MKRKKRIKIFIIFPFLFFLCLFSCNRKIDPLMEIEYTKKEPLYELNLEIKDYEYLDGIFSPYNNEESLSQFIENVKGFAFLDYMSQNEPNPVNYIKIRVKESIYFTCDSDYPETTFKRKPKKIPYPKPNLKYTSIKIEIDDFTKVKYYYNNDDKNAGYVNLEYEGVLFMSIFRKAYKSKYFYNLELFELANFAYLHLSIF